MAYRGVHSTIVKGPATNQRCIRKKSLPWGRLAQAAELMALCSAVDRRRSLFFFFVIGKLVSFRSWTKGAFRARHYRRHPWTAPLSGIFGDLRTLDQNVGAAYGTVLLAFVAFQTPMGDSAAFPSFETAASCWGVKSSIIQKERSSFAACKAALAVSLCG